LRVSSFPMSTAKGAKRRGKKAAKQTKQNEKTEHAVAKVVGAELARQVERLSVARSRGIVDEHTLVIIKAKSLRKRFGPKVWAYALMLHDPEMMTVRYPDEFGAPVALYRSIQEFTLPLNPDGRAGLVLTPRLGDSTDVRRYKAYVPAADAPGWSTGDWSSPDNFVPDFSRSSDPREDPEAFRFRGEPTSLASEWTGGISGQDSSLLDPFKFGDPATTEQVNDTGATISRTVDGRSRITFPQLSYPTIWRFKFQCWIRVPGGSPIQIWPAATAAAVPFPTGTWPGSVGQIGLDGGSVATTGAGTLRPGATDEVVAHSYAYTFEVAPGGGYAEWRVQAPTPGFYDSAAFDNDYMWRISLTRSPKSSGTSNPLLTAGRIIALSALVKWTGSTFYNGGVGVAAQAPRNTLDKNLFTTNPEGGFQPFQHETYTRLKGLHTVLHSQRVDQGLYASYSWTDILDKVFRNFEAMNAYEEFAPLCLALQYAPGVADLPVGAQAYFLTRVVSIMEYKTTSDIPELASSRYRGNAMADAAEIFYELGIPNASENDFHSVVTGFFTGAGDVGEGIGRTVGRTAGGVVGGFKDASGTLPTLGVNFAKGTGELGFKPV